MKRGRNKLTWAAGLPCVICGKPIEPHQQRTSDHFVPAAYLSGNRRRHGAGIVYPAHHLCNQKRGHAAPSQEMVERAGAMLANVGYVLLCEALENIETAIDDHRTFLATLEDLREEVGRRMEAERGE